jgi:hypothetical protein
MRMLNRPTLLAVLIFGLTAAAAQPTLTSTETFRKAYSMSFYGFDFCGADDLGPSYRKALREKVEHCPFTAEAKAAFGQWANDADKSGPAGIRLYIAEHDKLPESLDERRVACRKEKETPAYRQTVALLAGYAKGAVKYDAVVPDACDTKASAQ